MIRKLRSISKIMASLPEKQTITMQILFNIPRRTVN